MTDDPATDVPGGSPAAVPPALAELGLGALAERLGIEIVEFGVARVVGRMPVAGNTQPYGLLHGGASCVLAEQLASCAAGLHGHPDRIALGIELNASHHRAVRDGVLTGVATPLRLGSSIATHDVTITDEDGRRICTARVTCALRRVG